MRTRPHRAHAARCARNAPWPASFARAAALLAVAATGLAGCGSTKAPGAFPVAVAAAPPPPVAPAPPPSDDGQPAEGGRGGAEHAAALEELHVGPLAWRTDRQRSVRLLLPDAPHWLRVKFWGMQSLLGFRYGKDHHAIVGGTVVHVDDESAPEACGKAFEREAAPWVDSFDVSIEHAPPRATTWNGKIVDIDSLVATTATLGVRDQYAVAYATYPAWKGACLVVGVAVPARSELERAKAVCERFVADVLPRLEVLAHDEPRERY